MKKTIAKINKTKSWFFEKFNKIDKPLTTWTKREREDSDTNIRNESVGIITNSREKKRIIRSY